MKKQDVNIALIGCGRIGFLLENDPLRNKPCTHFGGASAAGLSITHACDISGERLSRFGKAAGIPRENLFEDYRALIRAARPRLCVIATWTESHERIAVEASRGGAAVIVLEKPMASSLPGCRRIMTECRHNGTAVIINHERRFDGRYRKVKEMISRGTIGAVKTVHGSILTGAYGGPSDPGEGGGPLLHDGTHLVDMIRFLLGDIAAVEGEFQRTGRSRGFEDRACAWLKTAGGIDVFLEAGGGRKYFVFELSISGTLGKIVIGNGYESLFLGRESQFYTGFRDLAPAPFPRYRAGNCFRELYREAKRALGGHEAATSTAEDGYRALEAIHAVYLSSHKGRKTVSLPVAPRSIDLEKIFGLAQKSL
ncbi:MAG: Gfo/Idh/MocA family oxidoreductase [Spirochaetes bacterium]|nr:Gfo/Idh/MocA family oxidoreductase [Spirochaetota bacterium]